MATTADSTKTSEAPKEVKVLSTSDKNRVHFIGTDDDARDYVERNFPRPHIQPGAVYDEIVPDVELSHGARFDGVSWSDEKGK